MKLPSFTPSFLAVNKDQDIFTRFIKCFCRIWIRVAVYVVIPVCIIGALGACSPTPVVTDGYGNAPSSAAYGTKEGSLPPF